MPHVINFVHSFLYRVLTDCSVQFRFCLCFLYFVIYVVDPLQNHVSSYSMTLEFRRFQLIDKMDIITHQLVKSLSVYPLKFIVELYSLSIFSVAKLILPLKNIWMYKFKMQLICNRGNTFENGQKKHSLSNTSLPSDGKKTGIFIVPVIVTLKKVSRSRVNIILATFI